MFFFKPVIIFLFIIVHYLYGYKNHISMTPPMGWMAWGKFLCNTDCQNYPNSCISENLFKEMADMMVSKGFRDAGYTIVSVDDCWADKKRDINQKLQHDPIRFPSGMKHLANYIHSKGLKFGLYLSYGKYTCMGHTPGSLHHMGLDALTMAEWDVDYIKVDGCFTDHEIMDVGYPAMGYFLNKTGRPMVYSCSWPFYQEAHNMKPDYSYVRNCHLWRNYNDIYTHWSSVRDVIDHYTSRAHYYSKFHGPNGWTDPDQLVVGNPSLTIDQAQSHMAIWAILAAPLMMSNDLRDIEEPFVKILTNPALISINQDPMGSMGTVVHRTPDIVIWKKDLSISPNSCAILFYNPSATSIWSSSSTHHSAYNVTTSTLGACGITCKNCKFSLYDIFHDPAVSDLPFKKDLYIDSPLDWIRVNPNGVVMYKVMGFVGL